MTEANANAAFTEFLDSLDEGDREWFEERLAIIQFSGEKEMPEIEAARLAYKCLINFRKNRTERKAA
jgi:hypothetical protein